MEIYVKSCRDCCFDNNEYCNIGGGYIRNHWLSETKPENCPLLKGAVTVKLEIKEN